MYDHYQWSLYGNCFLSFALNKQPFLRGSIYLIGAHTKGVAKKGASIQSIAVFFKIRDNILKNYLLFRLERTGRMGMYSGLQEAFKDLGIQQISMRLKSSIPVR